MKTVLVGVCLWMVASVVSAQAAVGFGAPTIGAGAGVTPALSAVSGGGRGGSAPRIPQQQAIEIPAGQFADMRLPAGTPDALRAHVERQFEDQREKLRLEEVRRKINEVPEGATLLSDTGGQQVYRTKEGHYLTRTSTSSFGPVPQFSPFLRPGAASGAAGTKGGIQRSAFEGPRSSASNRTLRFPTPGKGPFYAADPDAFGAKPARGKKQKVPLFRDIPEEPLPKADFLVERDYTRYAIPWYEQHLAGEPEDVGASVRYALALIDAGRTADGVAKVSEVYLANPTLADVSLDGTVAAWGGARVREAVTRTVTHANRTVEARAWMTVAILMEAEGRPELAGKMLERAEGAGLDVELASRLAAMIGRERS